VKKIGIAFLALAFFSGTITLPVFAQDGGDKAAAPAGGTTGSQGKSGTGQSKQKKKRKRNNKKKKAA
jgi:hypothetical protein